MKVSSNFAKDIRRYYAGELEKIYSPDEANSLIMILLEHYFNINRIKIATEPELRLSESELLTLHFAVKDLMKNKPVQYVIGETEFCEMRFSVDENVLIPRPETEEMVKMIAQKHENSHLKILDIGTGSGCIAISLAKLLKNSELTAIDISEKALETAKKNAANNNLKIHFINDDILNPKSLELIENQYDIIVSNPPYVCETEKKDMRANVLDYEPSTALFVNDDDPLVFYRKILEFAKPTLRQGGEIWFEINERFGAQMQDLCFAQGFDNVVIIKDFRGKERFLSLKFEV